MISVRSEKRCLLDIVAASLSTHHGYVAGQQIPLKLAKTVMFVARSHKTCLLGIVAASLSTHCGSVAGQQNPVTLSKI